MTNDTVGVFKVNWNQKSFSVDHRVIKNVNFKLMCDVFTSGILMSIWTQYCLVLQKKTSNHKSRRSRIIIDKFSSVLNNVKVTLPSSHLL